MSCCRKEINALPYMDAVVIVVGSVGGYWNSHVCVSQPTNQIVPSAQVWGLGTGPLFCVRGSEFTVLHTCSVLFLGAFSRAYIVLPGMCQVFVLIFTPFTTSKH